MVTSLPVEILDLIASFSNGISLVHLCLTTKRLHAVAERHLYRKIHLTDLHCSVIFFQTITARPNLALATRDFFFDLEREGDCIFVAFWNIFSRTLRAMPNLTALHFSGTRLSDIIFRDNTHPNLVRFTSVDYVSPGVSGFLTRHPSLKQVFVGEGSICLHSLLPPSALPSVDTLIGSIHEMGGILPGRHVTHLIFTWFIPFSDYNTHKIVQQLTTGAAPVRSLNCTTFEISFTRHAIVKAVSRYLPRLLMLKMANVTTMDRFLDDVSFIDVLSEFLPSLRELQVLHVPSWRTDFLTQSNIAESREAESKLALQWRKSCPDLGEIVFPNGSEWLFSQAAGVWMYQGEHYMSNPFAPVTSLPI